MADFPLLPLPLPRVGSRPKGQGYPISGPKHPSPKRQGERFGPVFQRLANVLDFDQDSLTLRNDPSGLAPERALVFEIAGSLDNFAAATQRIPGLEYLGEDETEFYPDDDFWIPDTRKGREGQRRLDKQIGGRLYLVMPDVRALREILSLWKRYQAGQDLGYGYKSWFNLFNQLKDIRAWGPEDRLSKEDIRFFQDIMASSPNELIRAEIELWRDRGRRALNRLNTVINDAGGSVITTASIPDIAYDAALVEIPVREMERLIRREEVALALCDDIMFVRPQAFISPYPVSEESETGEDTDGLLPLPPGTVPIAAIFDGVPVQRHRLLDGRVMIDDPDALDQNSVVARRVHGTGMASLIIHGDRNLDELPITRTLYLRPVLYAPSDKEEECFQPDRLLIDTIYRAVLRMKESEDNEPPMASEVFLINLSLGDTRRPFAGPVSPWARLLDHLAHKYNILFLVSAGNITAPLDIPGFSTSIDFEDASLSDREHAVIEGLAEQRFQRTLLSPGEAMNVITVGACHDDAHPAEDTQNSLIRPYDGSSLPNVSSAMGLGHRKVVKPDILMPGGREHVRFVRSGDQLTIKPAVPGRYFGIRAAAPDAVGSINQEHNLSGTSVATALATRAAHQLFDALMRADNGAILGDADSKYYASVVRALLVHRTSWHDAVSELEDIFGPSGSHQHIARKDNATRLIGYGIPRVTESMECTANRATLIGYGDIYGDQMASYHVPLPPSLERVKEPRAVTVTLAWFSPANVSHRAYRMANLEVKGKFKDGIVTGREQKQPSHASIPRGSLFHQRWVGEQAKAFADDGYLMFDIVCKEPAGKIDSPISYGLIVTIEAGEHIPVYQEVRAQLVIRPRA